MCISSKGITYVCLMLVMSLTACLDAEESEYDRIIREEEQEIIAYLEKNNQEAVRTESGIFYEVLEENNSGKKVALNDIVTIEYNLSTLQGKHIDSARLTADRQPVRFQHASSGIFPQGINMGVAMMREGEKYRFYIPSVYAFYNYSYRDLLPYNAILIADIKIVRLEDEEDIQAQDKAAIEAYIASHQLENVLEHDSGFFYQTIKAGSGSSLRRGQMVEVAYKGLFLNDTVFNQSKANEPFKFAVGLDDIIPGFEQGIMLMKKGEKGRIMLPSRLAYGRGVQVLPEAIRKDYLESISIRDWRPFIPVVFEVELLNVN